MEPLPFELASAVQDLFDLYSRINPAGSFRNRLLGNIPAADEQQAADNGPTPSARLDEYLRGASCLLANDLEQASVVLTTAAWRLVREIARNSGTVTGREPAFYRYISYELAHPRNTTPAEGYRLFGEVLAVYLDIISTADTSGEQDIAGQVSRLRARLDYSGESSPSGSAGTDSAGGSSA